MSAEIICVGTELLLGEILNSNAQYLAQQLAILGIPHYYQTVVGDNRDRLKKAMKIATSRSSILIFTGGLGPTPDDLTTETIAEYFSTRLVERAEIIQDLTLKFAQRGKKMTLNNLKQALIPEGATILPNPLGTAPGIIWQPKDNLTILTFPGVPSEMKRMWQDTATSYLISQGWGKEIIYSQMLRFRGIGESALAEKLSLLLNSQNPTLATYVSHGEVRLRIATKAESELEANSIIEPIARQIKTITWPDYYGCEDDTIASVVGGLLQEAGETLSVAESCTGGGLGQLITEIPGSSRYFRGGVIAYDNQVKISLLGVYAQDLAQFGAVSEVVAEQMALGVKKLTDTDWALSITGIAGPDGGTPNKPIGLVYIGLAMPDNTVESFTCTWGAGQTRQNIRDLTATFALDCLRRKVLLR